MKLRIASLFLASLALVYGPSCSSSSDDSNTATGPLGGAVTGPEDNHCPDPPDGVSDPAACLTPDTGDEAAAGAASTDTPTEAGGAADCNLAHDVDYGDTLYNKSGRDDDCKYELSWVSTDIRKGEKVTFTVTAKDNAGAALERIDAQKAGAKALSRVELYIPCQPTHLAPAADLSAPITETMPGVYSVGPIVFDASGRWVVRFHFYEECVDSKTSPHGHAAFFVDVP